MLVLFRTKMRKNRNLLLLHSKNGINNCILHLLLSSNMLVVNTHMLLLLQSKLRIKDFLMLLTANWLHMVCHILPSTQRSQAIICLLLFCIIPLAQSHILLHDA
ncbi:hypothetical protein CEUSTIGMA_g2200.t1 [Chlamydomonas eustigma]|uniref:Uncharacterized protein n=1 Tax=Chlamydomonas eustigma TaxID=1157962 RepID=A0A250WV86_9CHLO|nr:hypothetical protein CEUSTIGMA_g2200.t1 [Chlamydomonas eustigma]|eukprot:GAX74753.1 hypothetical protein CEUSTIGMA_g2200.t1 [Chlamydomonas eustigma]